MCLRKALNEGWGFCPTDAFRIVNNRLQCFTDAQRRVGLLPHRREKYAVDHTQQLLPLNEGWGFCPTDASAARYKISTPSSRSTKGGASAPPTLGARAGVRLLFRSLNEGWGFCPTDAIEMETEEETIPDRSTKGGASAPPTLFRQFGVVQPIVNAQRRVGLLPHRRP